MDFEDKTTVVETTILSASPTALGKRAAYFVVIKGSEAGRMYKIDANELMIGRAMEAGIRIVDDGVSRRHAKVQRDGASQVRVMDLGSTNGTFVNGDRIDQQVLVDGDKIQIGTTTILKFSYQDSVEEDFLRRQYESATRDVLTGCYNKKYFLDHMPTEFAFARRHRKPLSLALCDIDHFKKVNDTYGHPCGDYVLKAVAQAMTKSVRTEDTLARWGGEEFALIMRDTRAEEAFIAAERIRRSIESSTFDFEGHSLQVTMSLGVATWTDDVEMTLDQLVKQADDLLYDAKNKGRNRTETTVL
ncbi:MAG: GGDEF domain-containing protein [Myxococcota bacterium]